MHDTIKYCFSWTCLAAMFLGFVFAIYDYNLTDERNEVLLRNNAIAAGYSVEEVVCIRTAANMSESCQAMIKTRSMSRAIADILVSSGNNVSQSEIEELTDAK